MFPKPFFETGDYNLVPYEIPEATRIQVQPLVDICKSHSLLVYERIPFTVKIFPISLFSPGPKGIPAGTFLGGTVQSINSKTNIIDRAEINFVYIDIDVPRDLQDVVLFHELREMYYMLVKQIDQSTAHRNAILEEEAYVKRFLSVKEQKAYTNFVRIAR